MGLEYPSARSTDQISLRFSFESDFGQGAAFLEILPSRVGPRHWVQSAAERKDIPRMSKVRTLFIISNRSSRFSDTQVQEWVKFHAVLDRFESHYENTGIHDGFFGPSCRF